MSTQRPPLPYDFLPSVAALDVQSKDFSNGAVLSKVYAFDQWGVGGENRSPQLSWSGAPAGTKSFAVTCFDPDAPTGSGFWHWLVVNLPAGVNELATNAGAAGGGGLPAGAMAGRNDFGNLNYDGPGPPPGDGPHRYLYAVHALSVERLEDVTQEATAALIGFNVTATTLARGVIIGEYAR